MKTDLLLTAKCSLLVFGQKIFSFLLIFYSVFTFAIPNYVYHEASTNFVNGINGITYRSVITPNSSQSLQVAFKIEFPGSYTNSVLYYTTDGSNPSGSFGVPIGTTQIAGGIYDSQFGATLTDVVKATIPAQKSGTIVKYIVSAWFQFGGDEIFGNGAGPGCSGCGIVTNNYSLATIFSYTIPDYVWNGSASSTWSNPQNWTPNSEPSATDNVIINTPGTNQLNITGIRTINNFTVNSTGTFNASSSADFTINGDFNFGGTATANLNCASFFRIKSSASQNIPALTYGNLDISGGPRILSPTGVIKICSDFTVDSSLYSYISTGSTVEYISPSTGQQLLPFTYNNLTFSGTGNFSLGSSIPTGDKTINVNGNYIQSAGTVVLGDTASNLATLNINGDMMISGGTFDMNKISGGKGTLNLKGDLKLSTTAILNATSNTIANTNFNFTGTGDGLSPATTQTIDVANQTTASNITFNVNSGSYVQLFNQDFALGTNTAFNLKTGGTVDFGFNGSTALNLIRVGSQNGQSFTSEAGSFLKISSPDGITKTATLGNVQVPVASRFFNEDATFYLIGKANAAQVALNGVDQVTGNAFPTSTSTLTSLKVIVDLGTTNTAQDDVSVKSLGITKLNNGGCLKIIKGKVVNEAFNAIEDNSGQNSSLMMTGGRLTISRSGTQPNFGGTYSITGGVIEFAGNSAVDIRTSQTFLNVEISGTNVSKGSDNGGVILLLGGSFRVKDNGVYKVANTSGFSGSTTTAVRSANSPAIYLEPLSTIEYNGIGNQVISKILPTFPTDAHYQNLKISGTGVKTATGITTVKNTTNVDAAELLVASTLDHVAPNEFYALKGITVNNALGAKFRLANNANLFQDASAINVGDIITERQFNLSGTRQQYNYVVSPLIGTNLNDIYKDASGNPVLVPFVLYHSEATNKFYTSSGAYIPGRALAIKEPTTTGFAPATMMASFSGVPKNGTFTFNVLNSNPIDLNRGYNLIGNPYPSNLDLTVFYTNNAPNLDPTFKFWDNKANTETSQQGNGYSGNAYAQFNASLLTGTKATGDAGTSSLKVPTQYVKIGQGFMARALVNNASVTFDNSIRKAGISESFFGKGKSDDSPVNRFWLSMINPNNIASQIAVVYLDDGNDDFTIEDSFSSGASDAVYSIVGGEKISINGKNTFGNSDIVKLGSTHFFNGIYTMVLDNKEGIFENGQNIYLKDNQTGMITNLSEGSYTFAANAGENTGRFEIIYQPESVLITDSASKEEVTVYRDAENFVIKSAGKKITAVEVYDAEGRLVFQSKPNASKAVIAAKSLTEGVYFLKIQQDLHSTMKKIRR